jgi:ABC-2 type transport system ATP-binding protein
LDEVEKVCSHVVVLLQGENLYTGRVDEMTSTNGFFELKSDDLKQLKLTIETLPQFKNVLINEEEAIVVGHLNEELQARDLNKLLFKKDIILTHIVKRKESLEEQFLQLTNKN